MYFHLIDVIITAQFMLMYENSLTLTFSHTSLYPYKTIFSVDWLSKCVCAYLSGWVCKMFQERQ